MQLNSLEDTFNLSKKIGKLLSNGDVIFLYGEIGVGKTTFVRSLINNFEMQQKIKKSEVLSPTFNIVFNYEIGKIQIMHYDLFRLKNSRDIEELGIFAEENSNIVLVEWPKLIEKKPKNRIELFFSYSENLEKRVVNITGCGKWNTYDFNKI
tara:strand:- start:37 stop:492 length:456 start_codon:yes stop_codon:yes gene_type:complete